MELNRQNWHGMGETPECGRVLMLMCNEDRTLIFQLHALGEDTDWAEFVKEMNIVHWAYFEDIAPVGKGDAVMTEGLKNDRTDHKERWDLLPLPLIEEVVKVYTFGAGKYAENSWQNLPDGYRRYKAALLRHIVASEKGEANDPESGLNHLAHAAWNAIAMLHFKLKEQKAKEGGQR